jgi:hypothetical protein
VLKDTCTLPLDDPYRKYQWTGRWTRLIGQHILSILL